MQTTTAKTTRHAFGTTNIEGKHLFEVCEGVPIVDALNTASSYLSSALEGGLDTEAGGSLAAAHLVEMGKALLDSVIGSIEFEKS